MIREITGQETVPFGDGCIALRDTVLSAETCEELWTPAAPHVLASHRSHCTHGRADLPRPQRRGDIRQRLGLAPPVAQATHPRLIHDQRDREECAPGRELVMVR